MNLTWNRLLLFATRNCSTLSPRLKFEEIPNICSSERWTYLVREGRATLPTFRPALRPTSITVQEVVQRLSNGHDYLVETFKHLVDDTETNVAELRWPGLITLLLCEGTRSSFDACDFLSKAMKDSVWSCQVQLAEAVNLIYCHFLFRNECRRLELSTKTRTSHRLTERTIGHYFLSTIINTITSLRNDKVLFLMSKVLESLSGNITNSGIVLNLREWEKMTFYPQGQMLAVGCQCTLELAGFGEREQQMAFDFGCNLMAAIRANGEIRSLCNYQKSHSSVLSLSSFPVAMHLCKNPETLALLYSCSLDNLDYHKLSELLTTSTAIGNAKRQLFCYIRHAKELLQELQINHVSMQSLVKLLHTLENTDFYEGSSIPSNFDII